MTSRLSKFGHLYPSSVAVRTALVGATFALLLMACTIAPDELPALEQRATSLNKNIMCPICPGESIDQSQATIALQMRDIVREKLAEGWTDRQITDFFVDRYGPSVLMKPQTEGFTILAWIVPPVVVGVAVISFLLAIRWMRASERRGPRVVQGNDAAPNDGLERYYERIEAALEPRLTGASAPTDKTVDDVEEPNG